LYSILSGDARFVVLSDSDLSIIELATGEREALCVGMEGEPADAPCLSPSISHDGRFVAFASAASNLSAQSSTSTMGIYLRDRLRESTVRMDVSDEGELANCRSGAPWLSADGRLLYFHSLASNLVPFDVNGQSDVFVVGVPGAPVD
jgi:Tol biopolymer transport system component